MTPNHSKPMSPSTTWKEEIEPGEHELFERFARDVIVPRQKEVAQRPPGPRPLQRCLHYKTHAGVMAEFQVLPNLPEHARFGVFKEPRLLPAVVRFSNGESFDKPDQKAQPRGIAIKLVGVSGPKLLEDQKEAVTQDFLATSHSVTSTVRNVRQFMAFIESAIEAEHSHVPLPFIVARKLGIAETARIFIALGGSILLSKVRSMATEHYVSPAPIKLGPYAVKFAVQPAEGTKPATNHPPSKDFLREELADRLRDGDLMFDFVVQFYVNDRLTPIEDTSVLWKPEYAPFVTVARLRIPKCDLADPDAKKLSDRVDRLSFTPWHTTEDHRPLGNVMRARKVAYRVSSDYRQHDPEPASLPLKGRG
jgi:hypothetical protein